MVLYAQSTTKVISGRHRMIDFSQQHITSQSYLHSTEPRRTRLSAKVKAQSTAYSTKHTFSASENTGVGLVAWRCATHVGLYFLLTQMKCTDQHITTSSRVQGFNNNNNITVFYSAIPQAMLGSMRFTMQRKNKKKKKK